MSEPPHELPPKKDVALALLEGESLLVHLDPRRDGVAVPRHLSRQPQLVLQVGLNLPIAIPDLVVDDERISCTLSFNRSPFWCCVPWSAVYALVGPDGRGMLWPADVPEELASQLSAAAKITGQPKPRRGHLRAVPDESAPTEPKKRKRAPKKSVTPAGETTEQAKQPTKPRRSKRRAPSPETAPTLPFGEVSPPTEPARSEPRTSVGPSGSAPTGRKPRRELPPYLRIIK